MSLSPSRGKALDVGTQGLDRGQLPPMEAGPINLASWFASHGPDVPIDLEIGSGKGTFLVQQAAQTPGVNYIGIEYARPYWRYAADRCRRHRLENVRIVHAEAASFLRDYVPRGCLRQVHIYFPDPWPKKRHHKRRLIRACFLSLAHAKLIPTGQVRITTDHGDYFQWICQHSQQVGHLFEQSPFVAGKSVDDQEWVGTNFERKYRREGRSFYGMILRRHP